MWREFHYFLSRYLSPAVMVILLVNVALFLFYTLFGFVSAFSNTFFFLMETPRFAIGHFYIWQFVTYMFMHAGFGHLFFNMLVLWFFAPRLEYRWGTSAFVRFYFTVGIGAGIFHALVSYATGYQDATMLGASGALYGIMLAYALYYPDDTVLVYFVLPIKIKYLMIIVGLFTFFASFQGQGGGGISHITHLGGLLIALVYLLGGTWWDRLRRGPKTAKVDQEWWRDYSNRR